MLRLYRLVRQIIDFHSIRDKDLPAKRKELTELESKLAEIESQEKPSEKSEAKKRKRKMGGLNRKIGDLREEIPNLETKVAQVEQDQTQLALFEQHSDTGEQVLAETAKLHAGDAENRKLWETFLPACRKDIQKIYDRLNIQFDHELGESFYHDQLADVVQSIDDKGISQESEGATCVFLDQFDSPMIIRKKDGAFLYSTTDLATIQYRMQKWNPDTVLYVVDHRQHEHFAKLFAVAERWGYADLDLRHISFGTILGKDGKPFKTRDGDTVGLGGVVGRSGCPCFTGAGGTRREESGWSARRRTRNNELPKWSESAR